MTQPSGMLIAELRGSVCRCGAPKAVMQTFCRPCYFRLPPTARHALYRPVGHGYEEAYQAAAALLDEYPGARA